MLILCSIKQVNKRSLRVTYLRARMVVVTETIEPSLMTLIEKPALLLEFYRRHVLLICLLLIVKREEKCF